MLMKISLQNLGKRFNREWIFRYLNYEFVPGRSYAITGPNGSGKSTLLQVIGGSSTLSEGKVVYNNSKDEDVYKHIAIAAPYLELVEEMTLTEFLHFHSALKPLLPAITPKGIIAVTALEKASDKQIRYFSSGMKQRVKLAQAIFSDVGIVLLDEPTTNLDEDGILLYKNLVNDYCRERLLIISSNDKQEYDFCDEVIDMRELKMV